MGLCTAAFGAPFGSLVSSKEIASGDYKKMYLIDKIAEGRPISVCVDGRLDKYALSQTQIDAALNSWFKHAHQQVVRAKRQREFKDLLPILSKGADIRVQNCVNDSYFNRNFARELERGSLAEGYTYASSPEDLRIILVSPADIPDGYSYFSEGFLNTAPYVVLNVEYEDGKDELNVLRHELGHALSLSDQYQAARLNSVAEYGTSDALPSMMTNDHLKKFTCDDADALIFALDCIAQKNISRGGADGWRSFCPQRAGQNYAYCKTKNREDLLWVSGDGVRYARYDKQGALTVHKEWNRINFSRLMQRYPQGLPFISAADFTPVYKGKYVSYKTSADMECAFSTRPESDTEVVDVEKGNTLIACVQPPLEEAFVLVEQKDGISVPCSQKDWGLSIRKSAQKNDSSVFIDLNSCEDPTTKIWVHYTPQVRFEYYIRGGKILVFMFPKDSAEFYVFFAEREFDTPAFAGAPAVMPSSAEEYPFLKSGPVDREASELIHRYKAMYLINYDVDRLDERGYKGEYAVSNQTLPPNFISHTALGRDAWALREKYMQFLEGSAKNWMPGSLSDGFVSADQPSRPAVRKQVSQSLAAQFQKSR